jgi:hypothetical protein
MHIRTRLALASLAATLVFAAAADLAGARRIEVSEQRFRVVFPRVGYSSEGTNVECSITLAGSFHSRTISKVSGQLIGYITSGNVHRPCNAGEAWLLNGTERLPDGTAPATLPWHVRYESFSGTLPNITRIKIQIIGYSYLEICIGTSCLYKSTAARPVALFLEVSGGKITSANWDEAMRVPLFISGGILCPAELVLAGAGEVTAAETTTRIAVRLVQ